MKSLSFQPLPENITSQQQPSKLLLVEDDESLNVIIEDVLVSAGHQVVVSRNGIEALETLKCYKPDLIISDLMMPEMDGFLLLEHVRQLPGIFAVPFIIISARTNWQEVHHARNLGVDDYLFKPFSTDDLLTLVSSRLERSRSLSIFSTHEAHLQTVLMLANVIEARDNSTYGHVERVQKLAVRFGKSLGWSVEKISILEIGAVLHDIGKITIPSKILNKRGTLGHLEYELVRQHPQTGAKMLAEVTHLAPAIPYVLYHHEHWDGRGYPYGLAGDQIPIEGRLLALVDSYDAMTSDRPYRAGLPHDQVVREITKHRGTQFDPALADQFLQLIKKD